MSSNRDSSKRELEQYCLATLSRLIEALSLYVGDRDVAKELAQEALIRVCEHWKHVQTLESRDGWTFRTAFNLANSLFRRRAAERRARARVNARVDVAAVDPDTASSLTMRHAINNLPEDQRQVILLRYYLDLSIEQVADALQRPVNTVKTHARRGLIALRTTGALEDDVVSESGDAR